ncbi:hypothetical protein MTR67_032829 [Solanum verrucosum]|uniref:Uncharacterized protein n=1 Tax=Solanum verrucosum TaxID=315347 RepID=A0AAF0U556_SOLVR|nr:hypothetical protein MTR67_032829 [Solanum verrucosum]
MKTTMKTKVEKRLTIFLLIKLTKWSLDVQDSPLSMHSTVFVLLSYGSLCLHGDYTKKPSMSMVVKATESVLDVEKNLVYSQWWS